MSLARALEHLRTGTAPDTDRAVAMLREAARDGDAEASRHLATLAAAGVGMPQSWAQALRLLFNAALAGSTSARGQLAVLAGRPASSPGETDDPGHWRALCGAVRIEHWLGPCERRPIDSGSGIVAMSGFLPRAACAWLIEVARPALPTPIPGATSAVDLGIVDSDVVVVLTRQRIATAMGAPMTALAPSRILRNGSDGACASPDRPTTDRSLTVLIRLNDLWREGDPPPPHPSHDRPPAAGDALCFASSDLPRVAAFDGGGSTREIWRLRQTADEPVSVVG